MTKKKGSEAAEEDKKKGGKKEDEVIEDEVEEEEEEPAEKAESEDSDDDEEEEDDSDPENLDEEERDLDAEIEEEEKLGKQGKKKSEDEVEEEDDEEDEDKQPVTRKDLRELQRSTLESTAFTIAKTLTENEKEARLVLATWKNRRYPKGLPLEKQLEEAYFAKFGRNLMGQSQEARRAFLNRNRAKNDGAGTHRDKPVNAAEPKLDPGQTLVLKQGGFKWNPKARRYEKKLRTGVVVFDIKTKRTQRISN